MAYLVQGPFEIPGTMASKILCATGAIWSPTQGKPSRHVMSLYSLLRVLVTKLRSGQGLRLPSRESFPADVFDYFSEPWPCP